jgi:hypothetical protein
VKNEEASSVTGSTASCGVGRPAHHRACQSTDRARPGGRRCNRGDRHRLLETTRAPPRRASYGGSGPAWSDRRPALPSAGSGDPRTTRRERSFGDQHSTSDGGFQQRFLATDQTPRATVGCHGGQAVANSRRLRKSRMSPFLSLFFPVISVAAPSVAAYDEDIGPGQQRQDDW